MNSLYHRVVLMGALTVALPALAVAEDAQRATGANILTMCGDAPLKVAMLDGFSTNTWRMTAAAEFRNEAAQCPNITEAIYMNAESDQQKYNSDIESLVTQGFNIIITQADYGEAAIPSYRAAIEDGTTVVPYFSLLKGEAGRDFSANVFVDQAASGRMWADWYGKNFEKANVVFFGGPPGSASSTAFFDGFKDGLVKYPHIKLLEDSYVVTNWSPVDAQQAAAAMIGRHPDIDGIVTDYGVTALSVVNAYQQAGLPVPGIATVASNNELNCKYLSDDKAGTGWKFYSIDGLTSITRYALRRAVAIHQGTEDPDKLGIAFPAFADTFAAASPACDPDLPADADLSAALPPKELKALFGR